MNKKGFTLIELLAVIVILAVIALIATPVIMNAIGSAKQKAFLDSAYGLVNAAELSSAKQVIEQEDNGYMVFTFNNGVLSSGSNVNLDYKGSTPQDGIIIVNELHQTDISIYDGTNCATKRYTDTNVTTSKISKESCLQSSRDVLKAIIDAEATELLIALSTKKSNEPTFDLTTINETNISSIFNATIENYKSLKVNMDGSNPNIVLVGKGNWDTYLVSGTSTNKVVYQGLVLYLDAANIYSYSGSGNTWYDLSGFNNNCVWGSIPTFNSNSYFVFDGLSNYGTITNNESLNFSSEQTLIMVLRHSFTAGRRNPWNQAYAGYGTWTHEGGNSMTQYFGNSGNNGSPYVGYSSFSTSRNIWNVIVATRGTTEHKWYLNGTLKSTNTNPYGVLAKTLSNITIGSGYAGYWQGDMAYVMAYNRTLSATEIQQNFDAIKSRFGL